MEPKRLILAPRIPEAASPAVARTYHTAYAFVSGARMRAQSRGQIRARQRRIGKAGPPGDFASIMLGASGIAGAVAATSGGGGGGGMFNGTLWARAPIDDPPPDGPTVSARSVGEAFTDGFANQVIAPWWVQWRGTWTEAGTAITCATAGGGYLACQRHTYTDGAFSVVGRSNNSQATCAVFGRGQFVAGKFSGYIFRGSTFGTILQRIDDDVASNLDNDATVPSNDSEWRIEFDGTTIEGYLDDALVCSAVDATYSSGKSGIGRIAGIGSTVVDSFTADPA